jgi:hypothetical protein
MAVHVPAEEKTFFVFGNPRNSPAISCYEHRSSAFSGPVILGENPNGDAHRNPTLLIDEAGFLYVFYGAHGHPTRVVKSISPHDISAWRAAADIEEANTYPQPWQLRPGELFVSYRAAPGWRFRTSADGAHSWRPSVDLIHFGDLSIYAVTIAETGGFPRKIHIAWEKMGGGSPEEIRTKALWARRYNVYYAYSDDGGQTWRKRNGQPCQLPIAEAEADQVYDSGEHGVWLKDIQLDSQGDPAILFIDADVTTYDCRWKVARHVGGRWRAAEVARSDHMYDGGALVIRGDRDFRVYAPTTPSQPYEDGGEIVEWTSSDRGATWTQTRRLTSGSEYSHNHVKTVFNHRQGDFRVMWSYGDSHHPPETRNVFLYYYGEAQPAPARMAFPASCLRSPSTAGRP